MPEFFIPDVPAEKADEEYAAMVQRLPRTRQLPPEQRPESIRFVHDGVTWTATVGSRLQGVSTVRRRRRGKTAEVTTKISDPGVVCAIVEGDPYYVYLDRQPPATQWAYPLMAGIPLEVRRFGSQGDWEPPA